MGRWRRQSIAKTVFLVNITFAALIVAVSVYAVIGTTNATPEEKDFYNLMMTAFSEAVPPGPEGWTQSGGIDPDGLEKVGRKSRKLPFAIDYHIAWEDTIRKQEAEALIEKALTAVEDEAAAELMEELLQKRERLTEEADQAADLGDFETEEALRREIDEIDKKIGSEDVESKKIKIMRELRPRDISINIWIRVNCFEVSFYDPVVGLPPVSNGMAFRVDGKELNNHEWEEAYTYVFLGNGWNVNQSNNGQSVTAVPDLKILKTKAQTIVIVVQADPERARKILEAINWSAFNELLIQ